MSYTKRIIFDVTDPAEPHILETSDPLIATYVRRMGPDNDEIPNGGDFAFVRSEVLTGTDKHSARTFIGEFLDELNEADNVANMAAPEECENCDCINGAEVKDCLACADIEEEEEDTGFAVMLRGRPTVVVDAICWEWETKRGRVAAVFYADENDKDSDVAEFLAGEVVAILDVDVIL